ncbi:MAG: hypothetical protein ABGX16_25605 [Pirellulales bacterium]
MRSDFTPVTLPDGDLEPVLQLAEGFAAYNESVRPEMIRILGGIARSYGAAGMAVLPRRFLPRCDRSTIGMEETRIDKGLRSRVFVPRPKR